MSTTGNDLPTGENQQPMRIMLPLDGSELAAQAQPVAETLCRQLSAELHIVSVIPYVLLPVGAGDTYISGEVYQQIEDEQVRAARDVLARAAATANDHGIQTRTHLARGDASSALLDFAGALRMSLIVMTTHGRTGLARFTVGSVADRVVRGGAAPVLLLRSFPQMEQQPDLSNALIPLDGSPQSEAPLFSIVSLLAGPVLKMITLLRVTDPRDGPEGEKACEQYLDAVRQRLTEYLGARDCAVNLVVLGGTNPAAKIIACADEGEYNLVLMATHGEAGVGRWAFGGVTDRVLRDGKTPLLLAHPRHS